MRYCSIFLKKRNRKKVFSRIYRTDRNSTTSSILATQGVSSKTVSTAVNSITKGMGTAGVNTTKSMVKIETPATTTSEVSIKTAEDKFKTKK